MTAKELGRVLFESHQEAAYASGYGVVGLGWDQLDDDTKRLHIATAERVLDRVVRL